MLLAETSPDTAEDDERFFLPLLDRFHKAISPRIGTIPDRLIDIYTETLRKASNLYRFDVGNAGGTTAPAIAERSEEARYWAFRALLLQASPAVEGDSGVDQRKVASRAVESLVKRMEGALRGYIDDARLRGQMPLGR